MELTQQVFDQFREWIYDVCGIHLQAEKQYLVRQRLGGLVTSEGCRSFGEFYRKLKYSPDAALTSRVIAAITTNETYFFRDQHPFDTFSQHLLPELAERIRERKGSGRRPVARIWSAGASTGQEAYSMAILIQEFCAGPKAGGVRPEEFEILGTDISKPALLRAEGGEYADLEVSRGLSPLRRDRYFEKIKDNCWQLKKEIRNRVRFRQMNFIEDFTVLGLFDLILCRNVLIYFDDSTKQKIFEKFARMLEPEAMLMLGASENIYGVTDQFASTRKGMTTLYRKLDGPPAPPLAGFTSPLFRQKTF